MDNIEKRYLTVSDFEIEERADKPPVLKGYAVKFDSLSLDLGGFRERFKPYSFGRSLANGPDVLALAQHDDTKVLGRRSAGTLSVEEDPFGIRVSITPPNTSYANDILESVRRKDISGMSFGFIAREENFLKEGETVIREITDADLFEVSIVTSPAYLSSHISVRSETLAKLEEFNKPTETEERTESVETDVEERTESVETDVEERTEETEYRMSLNMLEKMQKQLELESQL